MAKVVAPPSAAAVRRLAAADSAKVIATLSAAAVLRLNGADLNGVIVAGTAAAARRLAAAVLRRLAVADIRPVVAIAIGDRPGATAALVRAAAITRATGTPAADTDADMGITDIMEMPTGAAAIIAATATLTAIAAEVIAATAITISVGETKMTMTVADAAGRPVPVAPLRS